MRMRRDLVAVVGRPNVGKSTLFNRLVGDRIAIVEDEPGTTRDRLYATVEWRGREFTLVDTGGLDDGTSEVEAGVRRQAEAAIEEADVVMFVVDAQSGILPVEHDVADRLRRSRKPVVVAANKAESWKTEAQAAEFYELGLGELHTVSALQGIGTGDLLDAVVAKLPPPSEDETDGHDARRDRHGDRARGSAHPPYRHGRDQTPRAHRRGHREVRAAADGPRSRASR